MSKTKGWLIILTCQSPAAGKRTMEVLAIIAPELGFTMEASVNDLRTHTGRKARSALK